MLGKLIKHEWKDISRVGSVLLLLVLGFTVIGYLFLRFSPLIGMIQNDMVPDGFGGVFFVMAGCVGVFSYFMTLCVATYGMMFYTGFRFYKSMYSGQGYLTHTLPVKTGELFVSKIFVSGIWLFITYLAVGVSCMALVFGGMAGTGMDTSLPTWNEIYLALTEVGFPVGKVLMLYLFSFLVSPFMVVIQVFGSFTIGQLSRKFKVLMGFLVYIGIYFINYIITMIAQGIVMANAVMDSVGEMPVEVMFTGVYVSVFFNCIAAIVLGIVAYRIVKNKLNLS